MFKKQLLSTNDFNRYKRLKNLLDNQGISYKTKVVSEESSLLTRILYRKNNMYSIYVEKNDLEVSRLLFNQIR